MKWLSVTNWAYGLRLVRRRALLRGDNFEISTVHRVVVFRMVVWCA